MSSNNQTATEPGIDPAELTKAQVLAKTSSDPAPEADPKRLAHEDILMLPQLFQLRAPDTGDSDRHISEMARSLKRLDEPLTPIRVHWVGYGWACIDGHHRHEAYKRADYQLPVPVEVFRGTLDEARAEAGKANTRDKLPMSKAEKTGAAWTLLCDTDLEPKQVLDATMVTFPTIRKMKDYRDQLREQHGWDYPLELDWDTARRLVEQKIEKPDFDDKWVQQAAERLAGELKRTFGYELSRSPEVFWEAIRIYDRKFSEKVEGWIVGEHEDEEEELEF